MKSCDNFNKKDIINKMRDWVVNETGEWTNGFMSDEELIEFMYKNYKEMLDYFQSL